VLLPAEVVVQPAISVPTVSHLLLEVVCIKSLCCGIDALCKQRIVLKRARFVGLVHVSVDAAHAISGGSNAGIDCCSNGCMYAAAKGGAEVTSDDGERQARDVAAEERYVMRMFLRERCGAPVKLHEKRILDQTTSHNQLLNRNACVSERLQDDPRATANTVTGHHISRAASHCTYNAVPSISALYTCSGLVDNVRPTTAPVAKVIKSEEGLEVF